MCPYPYQYDFYYDPITQALIDEQKKDSYTPYVKVVLSKTGETTYTYYTASILQVVTTDQPNVSDLVLLLDNSDQVLTAIDFRGYQAVVSWGYLIDDVATTVDTPTYDIVNQAFTSQEGVLTCQLSCKGIISQLADDKASKGHQATGTLKEIVDQTIKVTLTPYTHCEAFDVVWHGDAGVDSINVASANGIDIEMGRSRLDLILYLLGASNCCMTVESDNKLHIRIPLTSGTDYDYEYSLDSHTFFWKKRNNTLLIPNKVLVKSYDKNDDGTFKYTGEAQDDESVTAYKAVQYVERADVTSSADAAAVATGVLNNIKQSSNLGELVVPMNILAKIADYVKVTDAREGANVDDNIGALQRIYQQNYYRMVMQLRGWRPGRPITSGFRADEEANEKLRSFSDGFWTASCPATYLGPGQWMAFLYLPLPNFRLFYLKAYGISYVSGHKPDLQIATWNGSAWDVNLTSTPAGSDFVKSVYKGYPELIAANSSLDKTMAFMIINDGETATEEVTAFVTYAIEKGPV